MTKEQLKATEEAMRIGHAFTYSLSDAFVDGFIGTADKILKLHDHICYSGDSDELQYERRVSYRALEDLLKEKSILAFELSCTGPVKGMSGRTFYPDNLENTGRWLAKASQMMKMNRNFL